MINRLRRLAVPGILPTLTSLALALSPTAAQAHTGADYPNRAAAQNAGDTRDPGHDGVAYRERFGASRVAATSSVLRPASWSVIRHWMQRTVEVETPEIHFRAAGHRAVVSDGQGGSVTAVVGVRHITADGHGQLIFFFHGQHFVGWDSRYESLNTDVWAAGPQRFDADYAHYQSGDALCCPSLGPVRVRYRWTGSRIQALRQPPRNYGSDGPAVRLR
jgi:LppP/LprE lipoprotein